jgi:6-phosphogluconolactonase (cycloisomerase 2 family)
MITSYLHKIAIFGFFCFATVFQMAAQSLSYSGPNSYNISADTPPTHLGAILVPTLDRNPSGMTFGDSGNKMYFVGAQGDWVVQYALSTPYDYSTRGPVEDAFRVNTEETSPQDVEFNDDGTRMYIVGNTGDDITEYALSSAWNVSSATFTDVFDARTAIENLLGATNGDLLVGMEFNNDGSKLYIADRRSDDIFEFDLSTNYDVSTAGAVVNNIPITGETNVRDISFNDDGTEIYAIGNQGDDVNTFPLSIAYDLSSVGTSTNHTLPSSPDNTPQAILIDDAGTTFWVAGSTDDEVKEYTLSSAFDFSSTITFVEATPFPTIEINPRGLVFNDDGTKLFVLGNAGNDINQYSLSPGFDLSDAITANLDIAFSLNGGSGLAIDNAPQGMAFNNDGSKLYIAGNQGDDINEITLSNNFDLSTGTITNTATFSIASEETTITDVLFNNDGSRFYITGANGDDMNQYQTKGNLVETSLNNGTIDNTNPLVITLTGDTFADADMDDLLDLTTEFTIANVPSGLTPVFTLSNGDTVATLTFTGMADDHAPTDDVANLIFTFTDAAFTSSNAADVALAVSQTNVLGIDFNFCIDEIVFESGSWTGGNNAGVPDDSATDLAKGVNVRENVTITADTNCDCLLVDSGVTLTVADGIKLEVTNLLQLDGDIRLNGEAQLLQTFSGNKNDTGTGTITIDQTSVTNNIYQSGYWTAPVTTNNSTFTIAGVMKDGTTSTPQDITFTDINTLDGDGTTSPITVSGRWLARISNALTWFRFFDPAVETFLPGEGYNMKGTGGSDGSSTQNYSFVGIPNAGDYSLTIDDVRLYLVGNPYPSALDADQFLLDNASAIGGTIYYYESGGENTHLSEDYTGGYATYNGVTGVPFGAGKTPGQYVPVAQSFFVNRDVTNSLGSGTPGTSATINFNNGQRDFIAEGATSVVFSREENTRTSGPVIKLGMEFEVDATQTFYRQIAVGFVGATRNFEDGLDAQMFGREPTDFAFTVEDRTGPYVIIGIEDFSTSAEIPLQVYLDSNRDVTFSVDQTDLGTQKIYLNDYQEGISHEIHETAQQLSINTGTYLDRFTISFQIPASLGTDDLGLSNNLRIFNETVTELLTVESESLLLEEVIVFNILGQQVLNQKSETTTSQIQLKSSEMKAGIYIVQVKTDRGILNKKIVIE